MSAAGATDQQQQANNAGSTTAASSSTREAILQAARQRFLHYGYKKTTIDEIAQDAGIGKGTCICTSPARTRSC
jgi:AcrR family transcriptional regulator